MFTDFQVPPAIYDEEGKSLNKGKMCVTGSSPPAVAKAYLMQFQEDFNLFLRSRSEELISGGRMVLTLLGRKSKNHMERGQATYWELLGQAFARLVSSVSAYNACNWQGANWTRPGYSGLRCRYKFDMPRPGFKTRGPFRKQGGVGLGFRACQMLSSVTYNTRIPHRYGKDKNFTQKRSIIYDMILYVAAHFKVSGHLCRGHSLSKQNSAYL